MKKDNTINIRFATKEEGQQYIRSNTQYYDRLTQADIDWRVRKEGATLDELIALAQKQVQDFTPLQMEMVQISVARIEDKLNSLQSQLPIPEEIVFVSTTMKEESEAREAYTSSNLIFLNARMLDRLEHISTYDPDSWPFFLCDLTQLIAHELFHCITRHSPTFRKAMYALIGFTVMDHDIDFPEHVRRMIMANPDVEHIDNYAEFTIHGEKRLCALLPLYCMTWSEASKKAGELARFFSFSDGCLVPLDDLDKPIHHSLASDFWDKLGNDPNWVSVRNTDYATAPEESLAVNFSYAITASNEVYPNPELIAAILDTLKNYKE